jgi:16S rRNA (cytidine1402-2'-O)-methyltransferase
MSDSNPPIFRLDPRKPAPGLHFVATPIGAARDITLRALDLLATADVLAAEDTRTLRHLMEIHGLSSGGRPILSYHDHNGSEMRPRILKVLQDGKSVVYASEAGTPLVADPGFQLARAAIAEGLPVFSAPGPSAVLAALTVAGLPTDRFLFAGFAPQTSAARRQWLEGISGIDATLVLYESPKRIGKSLRDMADVMGNARDAALCRELTKRFEEVKRGTLGDLARALEGQTLKGEIVVVIGRPLPRQVLPSDVETALRAELAQGAHLKDAAAKIARLCGLARREVYQIGLDLAKKG